MSKRQEKYLERLKAMSNAELFEAFIESQIPDDYDGGWTSVGLEEKEATTEEMRRRLDGWLKETK